MRWRNLSTLSGGLLICLVAAGQIAHPTNLAAVDLPYNSTCPIVYDNDSHDDMYTDEYLLALASAGEITLKGMITTSGGWREPLFPDPVFVFQWPLAGRSEIVGKAWRSGFTNLPTPVAGSGSALLKPSSGLIEDTLPDDTPGARLIVNEAKNASPSQPLVVVMGGPPTTLASAYLLDPSIADNVVLAWLGGGPGENDMQNYNDLVDRWATYIVVHRLRVVLFGPVFNQAPLVPKSQLTELPNTELRPWMIDKELPNANLPNGFDHDAPPAISLLRPDYVFAAKPKSFSSVDASGVITLQDDPTGNILMVTQADQNIGTEEWWRALENPAAYGYDPLPPTLTPFAGTPAVIPGGIEAEDFDYGGPEVAYHDLNVKTMDQNAKRNITTFRVTDNVDFDYCSDFNGGYAIARTQKGEWLNYSVNVTTAGLYTLHARVSSSGNGGIFHVAFDSVDKTGPIKIPNTHYLQNWRTISTAPVALDSGQHVMSIIIDANGAHGVAGDINYLDFELGDSVASNQSAVLGTWDISMRGSKDGVGLVTFNEDSTLTGYGIRTDCSGVFQLSGSWQKGRRGILVTAIRDSDCGSVQTQLRLTVQSNGRLLAAADGSSRSRWQGDRAPTEPILDGYWFGTIRMPGTHTTSSQVYRLIPEGDLPGVFDISDGNTDAPLGEGIVTSAHLVEAYLTINGNPAAFIGRFNSVKRILKLKTANRAARRIIIKASQQ